MRWLSPSPEATRAAARHLAAAIGEEGLVLALVGPLGAGKTHFVKGLAEGLGIDPARVASPTFVIASEYPAARGLRLAHVDLYRVKSEAELEGTGFSDLLVPGTVVAIEWGDRFPGALPADRLEIQIERGDATGASQRRLNAIASGERAGAVLARWVEALAAEPQLEQRDALEAGAG